MRATWNETVIAESDETVVVEGNHYFPMDSIRPGVLTDSASRSLCPWKGVASYYDVTAQGNTNPDAAWTYRKPWILARRIRGRVAFWQGVEVGPSPHRGQAARPEYPGAHA